MQFENLRKKGITSFCERDFIFPRHLLYAEFSLHGRAFIRKRFKIDESCRESGSGIFCSSAAVVIFYPF